jgi:fibronectin-binding autotransporter adhesin
LDIGSSGHGGAVTITGGGKVLAVFLYVFGLGSITITGGGNLSCSAAAIQNAGGAINVGGGDGISSFTMSGSFGGVGKLNITSGGLVTTPALYANGSISLDTGTLQITATGLASALINLLTRGGTLDLPNSNTALTLTSTISGPGGFHKTGPGTLILTAANTYAGPTIVDGGTLLANSTTGSGAGTGSVTVNSTATLGGTGAIAGSINIAAGGTLAPGASIGTLATGTVTLQDSTSVLAVELNLGATPAADLLNVIGTVTINNSLLSLSALNTADPSLFGPPKTFLILANDASDPISGLFGSISGLPSGYTATADYAYNGTDALGHTGDGNDLAITITAVPEPPALLLLLTGFSGAIAMRRKFG